MTTTSTWRRPPGRYDERRSLPRAVTWALLGVLGLALLVGVYAAWDRFSGSRVPFTLLGYDVVSDSAVDVRFEVHKAPSSTVRCFLRALDADKRVVGSETVAVGPTTRTPGRVEHRLSTTGRAVAAEVTRCQP